MLKYIRNKEYKKDQLKAYRTFNQSAVSANILPVEQICHLCCGNFSKPFQPMQKLEDFASTFWKL